MSVTLAGMVTLFIFEQLAKTYPSAGSYLEHSRPISVSDSGKVIDSSEVQSANACCPMVSSPSGSDTEVTP